MARRKATSKSSSSAPYMSTYGFRRIGSRVSNVLHPTLTPFLATGQAPSAIGAREPASDSSAEDAGRHAREPRSLRRLQKGSQSSIRVRRHRPAWDGKSGRGQ
jgi:hypothetical protein